MTWTWHRRSMYRAGPRMALRGGNLVLEPLEARDLPSFVAPPAFLAGPSPAAVATGDFNGDGQYDLAVANKASPGSVSVLLNSGGGIFQPPVSYATGGAGASALAVADVSGDGRLDLVVTNYTSGTVAVLRGSGTGLFRRPVTYAAGPVPTSLSLADFNGDDIPDLAVANYNGAVSVLLGQGGGAFQLFASYAIGSDSLAVTAGDFNSDGHIDLAAVGHLNST